MNATLPLAVSRHCLKQADAGPSVPCAHKTGLYGTALAVPMCGARQEPDRLPQRTTLWAEQLKALCRTAHSSPLRSSLPTK